jgi:hypothetical protein
MNEAPFADGTVQGISARASAVGIQSDRARTAYERRIGQLSPDDTLGRAAAKAQARTATPAEIRAIIRAKRPGLGPLPGSGARANISNPGVNRTARLLGKFGRGAGAIGVVSALADIMTSRNRARALAGNLGAGLGGLVGGAGGALAGAATGPAAPVVAPAGGVAGSLLGGEYGYRAGEGLYDFLARL